MKDMDIITCEKYMHYFITEIDKRLSNKALDNNSLMQLTLELDKLKKHVENSDLPKNIKTSIQSVKSKYTVKKMDRGSLLAFVSILTLGGYYYIFQRIEKSKRKNYLMDLRSDSNAILHQIRII